jgi:hypothetical protein
MAYEKIKKSFTIDGVDYKDIIGLYDKDRNSFSVSVAGTGSMIRQYMKAKYPQFSGASVLWVTSQSFANGNSIRIRFNRIPESYYKTISDELDKFEYGNYNSGKSNAAYKDASYNGMRIDYGTKYLSTNNQPPDDSKEAKMEAPDWDSILNSNQPKKTFTSPSGKRTYSSNTSNDKDKELLYKFASGWELYKTIISDNSILYSIEITKEVKKIQFIQFTDFSLLKGTMLTQEGFKWNPSKGRFEKWNNMDFDAIELIDNLLTKYYGILSGSVTNQQPQPQPTQSSVTDKEEVSKAIKALSYLAQTGDIDAEKAIKALKYLI